MRIALDLMTVEHVNEGDYAGLVLVDEFGNSVELYVHGDPREAVVRAGGMTSALTTLQSRLPAAKRHEYQR